MYADALSSLFAVTGLEGRVSYRVSLHAPYGVKVAPAATNEARVHVVRRPPEQHDAEPSDDPQLITRASQLLRKRDKLDLSELQLQLDLDFRQAVQLTRELEQRGQLGPASPQIVSFCVVTAGSLTIELASAELARLDTHDMLICSGTDPLVFRDGPERPLIPIAELRDEISGDPPCLNLDGVEAPGAGICGQFRYRVHLFDPLASIFSTPQIIRAPSAPRSGWLRDGVEAALSDNDHSRPGSVAAVEHMLHVLFLDALARPSASNSWGGWLEAVSDRHLGQALRLIHGWPGYAWTNSELSRRCGLERSAFVDQFQALTHKTPLQYLRLWRMELAAHALADSLERAPVDVPSLASELGFASVEMFSDVFATHFGVEPERWSAFEAADRTTPLFVGFTKR